MHARPATSTRSRYVRAVTCLCALALWWSSGCASTYTDRLSTAYQAVNVGDYETGVDELSRILGVDSYEDIPNKWSADRPLAALERGMLLQALGRYRWSARDLSAAETELEFLDMKLDTVGNIGKYIYSDSAEIYKLQPTERLALNALNMLNYLAVGNLEGAAVEARRFTLAREYLESEDDASHGAFGSYLAGFVFERLGQPDRALRYYEEALDAGDLEALRGPIARLSRQGSYAGRRLREYVEELEASGVDVTSLPPEGEETDGEILVVLGLGRVPYKVPEYMPIGAAIGYASIWVTGSTRVLARTAFKVVAYPELVARYNLVRGAGVHLDGDSLPVELLTDLGGEIATEYEAIKPKIIGAALTRMIARAVASEGVRSLADDRDGATAILAALATEAVLVGLDEPDTRSWTLLPSRVYMSRARVRPGTHQIRVDFRGRSQETREIEVDVAPGGFAVLVIAEPR